LENKSTTNIFDEVEKILASHKQFIVDTQKEVLAETSTRVLPSDQVFEEQGFFLTQNS